MFLTGILYGYELWALGQATEDTFNVLSLVVLVYAPTIFQVLNYTMMYHTLEQLQNSSRIESGTTFRSRFESKKCSILAQVILYTMIGLYFVCQVILILYVACADYPF